MLKLFAVVANLKALSELRARAQPRLKVVNVFQVSLGFLSLDNAAQPVGSHLSRW